MHELTGGGWRVRFDRRDDRYGHTVDLIEGQAAVPLIESVEGAPDDPWPPSPPWQHLHFERRPGGVEVALLVGMAGTSHWSASIELNPTARQIVFDVACRASSQPALLGSTYQLAAGLTTNLPTRRAEAEALLLGQGQPRASLRIETLPDQPSPRLCANPGHVSIELPAPAGPWPLTLRWRYCLAPIGS